MSKNFNFSENDYSEIIEMALSDHIPFSAIKNIYGIKEKEVKKIMRSKLKSKSYKLWRKRDTILVPSEKIINEIELSKDAKLWFSI